MQHLSHLCVRICSFWMEQTVTISGKSTLAVGLCACSVMSVVILSDSANNKHASQANSSCHVVNGQEYTIWRPADAIAQGLNGNITSLFVVVLEHYSRDWRKEAFQFYWLKSFCKLTHHMVCGLDWGCSLVGWRWDSKVSKKISQWVTGDHVFKGTQGQPQWISG